MFTCFLRIQKISVFLSEKTSAICFEISFSHHSEKYEISKNVFSLWHIYKQILKTTKHTMSSNLSPKPKTFTATLQLINIGFLTNPLKLSNF